MILAVPAMAIGLTPANAMFRYHLDSYAGNSLISASAVHTYTAGTPGLDFSGGLSGTPLWADLPGVTIPVKFSAAAYGTNGSIGALIFHHHNAAINRTQIISINHQNLSAETISESSFNMSVLVLLPRMSVLQ
jgi:hypothetical protein